jgi:hypothetical protein
MKNSIYSNREREKCTKFPNGDLYKLFLEFFLKAAIAFIAGSFLPRTNSYLL